MKLRLPSILHYALLTCFATASSAFAAEYTAVAGRPVKAEPSAGGSSINLNDSSLTSNDTITFNITGEETNTNGSSLNSHLPNGATVKASLSIIKFVLEDGYGSATYNFQGSVSSHADAVNGGVWAYNTSNGNGQKYNFTGDVSGFTGSFDFDYSGSINHVLNFQNNTGNSSKELNASATVNGTIMFSGDGSYTASKSLTADTVDIDTNTTLSGAVITDYLDIASNKTLTIASGGSVQVSGYVFNKGTINGTIDLGENGKIALSTITGGYTDGAEFTISSDDYSYSAGRVEGDDFSNLIANLGNRQTASINGNTVTVTTTETATLIWTGANKSYWDTTNWKYEENVEGGKQDRLQWGDSVILSRATQGRSLYVNKDLNLDTVTVKANHTMDVHGGATMSAKFVTEGEVTLSKAGDSALELHADSDIYKLHVTNGTANVNGTVDYITSTGGTVKLANTVEVQSVDLSGTSLYLLNGEHTHDADIDLKGGHIQTENTGNRQASSYNTVTVSTSGGTTPNITVSAHGNEAVLYTNTYIEATRATGINTLYTDASGVGQKGAVISNADIVIHENFKLQAVDLTQSYVTVKKELDNNQHAAANKFGNLNIEAGGSVIISDNDASASNLFSGAITMSLNSTTFSAPTGDSTVEDGYTTGYSTSALEGTMDLGSTLTLDLSNISIADDKIVFTFIGLEEGTNTLEIDDFSVTGWTVDRVIAAADSDTVLRLSRNTAAIPEPTTATLSLLALAGLAARRRRK